MRRYYLDISLTVRRVCAEYGPETPDELTVPFRVNSGTDVYI